MSKGSRNRTANFRQYDENFDRIEWPGKVAKFTPGEPRDFWMDDQGQLHDEPVPGEPLNVTVRDVVLNGKDGPGIIVEMPPCPPPPRRLQ
jgi:hypothetical protein